METPSPSEVQLRMRAYELWEADGCPPGKPDEYWHRALAELADIETTYDSVVGDSFPASDPPSHSGTTGPG